LAQRFPDDVRPQRLLLGLYLQLQRPVEAQRVVREVLRLQPTDISAHRLLEDLCTTQNSQDAAELALARLTPETPGRLEGLRLADLHASKPQAPSLSVPPDVTAYRAARLLTQAGRWREAMEHYARLLVGHDTDAVLLEEAGLLADQMGEDAQARQWLTRAVALRRGNQFQAMMKLALTELHAGSFAVAGRWFWKLTRQPDAARAWAGLFLCALLTRRLRLVQRAGNILARQMSKQERREHLTSLWREAAGGLELVRSRRGYDSARPQPSALEPLLQRAQETLALQAQRFPRRADAHYHLGVCQAALGQRTGANQSVENALEINPNYSAARRFWFKLGRQQRQAA